MAYCQLPNIINVLHAALSRQFQEQLKSSPKQTINHLKAVYGKHPCSCVSDGAREDLLVLIGNSDKVTTIYNPCDVNQIQPLASPPFSIKDFGLTNKG